MLISHVPLTLSTSSDDFFFPKSEQWRCFHLFFKNIQKHALQFYWLFIENSYLFFNLQSTQFFLCMCFFTCLRLLDFWTLCSYLSGPFRLLFLLCLVSIPLSTPSPVLVLDQSSWPPLFLHLYLLCWMMLNKTKQNPCDPIIFCLYKFTNSDSYTNLF